ncbi:pentatricopeptide repeat-containing protein At3g61360 [Ricinus communis]|uniref:pentatricopeptide repeat-containing protein At3g61360 n=1 Tax=Ricinus communis TaxID=3988 RepID=UPI00201B0F54|nr:pentatricopeptide repeat-containing protein At3g61360 [Ricinus communis]XP_015581995.2 pentatricopeptide repeat-containing protein At3g61360 [Ricinus communis]XP_015581996.2 pentatricopeptide repeat-containing protein At3g61360 [Ricinus communis]XP_015581997.2 pentatricopeptide repeat-containing protein At3g61360 [Ricinus communis]
MHSFLKLSKCNQLFQVSCKRPSIFLLVVCMSSSISEVERITKIINDNSFPNESLYPTLLKHLNPAALSTDFVENVLGRLFAAHSNGLKALEFFRFSLRHSHFNPSSFAFEMTLHILARMRYFEKAWELMMEIGKSHPSLLTLKSMGIMLSKIAKFQSYEDTLEAFKRMEKTVFVGKTFGTEEFNVLLQAFCSQREVKEARSVFQKMHDQFNPNTKTMNILLLGFKKARDITAMELFYHEIVRRGFKATSLTYNIRIDAYCKKGYFGDGLRIFEEMEKDNCPPTLETITTLIHGAGVARNIHKARHLFDEIGKRNLKPDTGAYNALISSLVKCKDIESAMRLMDEMEEKHIGRDSVTYHTIFFGLMKLNDTEGVCDLYHRMISKDFVPKTRTVVMLMKFFCVNSRLDLGLAFWQYMLDKGYCPHGHALDLLVTGLCSRGRLLEAYECSKQFVERGMRMSEVVYRMLERSLQQSDFTDKLRELDQMIKKLQSVLPPSKGHALAYSCTTESCVFNSQFSVKAEG